MLRGIEGRPLFRDDRDRADFVDRLGLPTACLGLFQRERDALSLSQRLVRKSAG
jgi:hypothetical protein